MRQHDDDLWRGRPGCGQDGNRPYTQKFAFGEMHASGVRDARQAGVHYLKILCAGTRFVDLG